MILDCVNFLASPSTENFHAFLLMTRNHFVIVPLFKESRCDIQRVLNSLACQKMLNGNGFHVIFSVDGAPETAKITHEILQASQIKSQPESTAVSIVVGSSNSSNSKKALISAQVLCNTINVGLRLNRCFALDSIAKNFPEAISTGGTVLFIDGDSDFCTAVGWRSMIERLTFDSIALIGANLRPRYSVPAGGWEAWLLYQLQVAEFRSTKGDWIMGGCFAFSLDSWFRVVVGTGKDATRVTLTPLAAQFATDVSSSDEFSEKWDFGEDWALTSLFRKQLGHPGVICNEAIVETAIPLTLTAYLHQKRRWLLGKQANMSGVERRLEDCINLMFLVVHLGSLGQQDGAFSISDLVPILLLILTAYNIVILQTPNGTGLFWLLSIAWCWYLSLSSPVPMAKMLIVSRLIGWQWKIRSDFDLWLPILVREVLLFPLWSVWLPVYTKFRRKKNSGKW